MNPGLPTPLNHVQPNSASALTEALRIWDFTPKRAREDPESWLAKDSIQHNPAKATLGLVPFIE